MSGRSVSSDGDGCRDGSELHTQNSQGGNGSPAPRGTPVCKLFRTPRAFPQPSNPGGLNRSTFQLKREAVGPDSFVAGPLRQAGKARDFTSDTQAGNPGSNDRHNPRTGQYFYE